MVMRGLPDKKVCNYITNNISNFERLKPYFMNKQYIQLIAELKQSIIQSRYAAARVANKEQLLLYFRTGKMLSEKIAAQKWGAKILGQIAEDLQKQLPGLRGFSSTNLKNMKQFYTEYQGLSISQSVTGQLREVRRSDIGEIPEKFFNISFTHHILIMNRCNSMDERIFYISHAATQSWSVSILEHQIESGLFSQQGKLPNNFEKTLPEQLKPTAIKLFQDE